MNDFAENLPLATPKTQTAPRARGGGTGGQEDFSRSAQRSRERELPHDEETLEPLDAPQKPLNP
jgi:hypothetical protein